MSGAGLTSPAARAIAAEAAAMDGPDAHLVDDLHGALQAPRFGDRAWLVRVGALCQALLDREQP